MHSMVTDLSVSASPQAPQPKYLPGSPFNPVLCPRAALLLSLSSQAFGSCCCQSYPMRREQEVGLSQAVCLLVILLLGQMQKRKSQEHHWGGGGQERRFGFALCNRSGKYAMFIILRKKWAELQLIQTLYYKYILLLSICCYMLLCFWLYAFNIFLGLSFLQVNDKL